MATATITIYGSGGSSHTVVPEQESVRKLELMKEDYVRLVFSTNQKINIRLGDYINTEWGTFYVTKPQKGSYNKSTGGYDYDIQFDAPHYRWNNKLYKFEPATRRNEASWSLTDNLRNHMAVFLRNLSHHGWNYTVDSTSYEVDGVDKAVFIQFENKYILDALTQIAEAFNVEWWITDNIIHLGKAEHGTTVDFEVGVNVEEMTAEKTQGQYITRLYAFGSTRNLPPDYRKSDEQVLLNGVVQKRVMMPAETPYVDVEPNLSDDEIVEGIVFFDDVFPRTEAAITSVTEIEKPVNADDSTTEATTDDAEQGEEQEMATFYRIKTGAYVFSKDYILAGQTLQVQFTSGRLNGMVFDVAFNPDGLSEMMSTHGEHSERVEVTNPDAQVFEIVRNDTYGLFLPNDTLKPSVGDRFILLGWDITKMQDGLGLVTAAEQEVLTRAQEYAARLKKDPLTYPCTMMSDYMYGLNNGRQDPNFSKVGTFELGQRIQLVSDAYFAGGRRVSRVVGYEYKLDMPYDSPVIYVGESATYSSKKDSEAKLNEAVSTINYRNSEYGSSGIGGSVYVIGVNDNATPGDGNVYSALRSDRQYARKNRDDIISSLWTFKHGNGMRRGIQTEDYSNNNANEDNLFGKGFELISKTNPDGDVRTRLEVDELFVRIKAFFAKLEIREISYVGGNYVFSAAGSRIYYVDWIDAMGNVIDKTRGSISEVYTFRCYLYSDDGTTATINKWAANDQAMCRTFNIDEGVHENVSNKYYWRRVTGVGKGVIPSQVVQPEYAGETVPEPTEYQYVDISMSDCGIGSDYPEAEDAIVQFGNWTNSARQGVIYLQVEGEGSPAIIEYSGVGADGQHFVIPSPTLLLSPSKNVIYGEFHSVVDGQGGNTGDGDTIDDQLRALIDALNDIKNQADKKMEIWFGAYEPLPNKNNPSATANYPASEWITDDLKALHAQDLFYDTYKAPATQRGRAWRWIATEGANNTVVYYWDDVTDQDTIDALEKIADVASDGKLTGGAEKVRVFLDWQKASEEYLKYTEQAHDYEITTELTNYRAAFKALGKLLNGDVDLITSDTLTEIPVPSWLQNLQTETVIPSPIDYRAKWADYYTTLAALLKEIQRIAKALADHAQADADEALEKISDMADDGVLDPTEKVTVKREFIALYHEMMDSDEAGYASGILDMAKDGNGQWLITYNTWILPYITAFRALGTYLNGGTAWTEPALSSFTDSTLPSWIRNDEVDGQGEITTAHMSERNTITGSTWRQLWSDFYAKRTAVLTALTEHAQDTADDAHDRIDDIVSDGVISAGSEKSLLYMQWMKTVAEYSKYIEQADDYTDPVGTANRYVVDTSAFTTAYKKLATMLNNQNPATAYSSISANILNGTTRPAWLTAENINRDTVLSETPVSTADAYRTIWNNYYVALTALLEVITNRAKELADAAQADATDALSKLGDMANDGKLDPSEKLTVKREFLAAWNEKDESGGLIDKCLDDNDSYYINYNTYVKPYVDAFVALGTYLNGGSTWSGGSTVRNSTYRSTDSNLPSWIQSGNMSSANDITGSTWRTKWSDFYTARTVLMTELARDAKERADNAQSDVDDAHDRIDDIVSDGIISGGAEKSQVFTRWQRCVQEYLKYTQQASDYNVTSTNFVTAYTALATMLNGGTTASSSILNGTTRPAWLTSTNILVDTTLSDYSLTADQYRSKWNDYYVQLTLLIEAIGDKVKSLADDALEELEDMADDDILTEFEKLICLRDWEAAKAERASLVSQFANDPSTSTTTLSNCFNLLSHYLDNLSMTDYSEFTGTAPALLLTSGNTTINGDVFKQLWRNYYDARSSLLASGSTSKIQVFAQSTRPTPPYKVGDLWIQTDNDNNMMLCVYGRSAGTTGAASDWADLSDITEKRDPRVLLAALCNMVYSYAGGYIRDKSSNSYLAVYLGSKPSSGHANGDISYYNSSVYQYQNSTAGWVSVSNDTLKTALDAIYGVVGSYTIRIYRTKPSSPSLYDLVCTPVNFTDSNAPSGYQTVEGGICIQMYNGTGWEVLQESTHSIIENIKGYIRAVAYQRAGDYSTAAGFISSTDWANLFAQATDADGNIIAQAHMSAFVTHDSNGVIESGVKIRADKIDFQSGSLKISADNINFVGKTVINNKFTVDSNGNVTMDGFTATNATITGSITATSGKIGGFKISGNGLTNENDNGTFTNDAYVILRNDSHRCFVGIGPNVLPSYSTARALARYEIEDNDDWFGGGANIALVLRAKNNTRNFAFMGEGNGVLNGWIGGCKFTKLTLSTANTIYSGSGYAELKTNNTFIVYSSVSNSGIGLPRLTEVRSALGISSSTNFAVVVTVISDLNSNSFVIRGRCRTQDSGGNKPWNTTELPLITHWDGSNWDEVPMGAGDSLTFLLVYDSNKSLTIDDYSCYYTARILNRQD